MPGEDRFTIWIKTKTDIKSIKSLDKALELLHQKLGLTDAGLQTFTNLFVKGKPKLAGFKKAVNNISNISKKLNITTDKTVNTLKKLNIGITKTGGFYNQFTERATEYGTVIKKVNNHLQKSANATKMLVKWNKKHFSTENPLIGLSQRYKVSVKDLNDSVLESGLILQKTTNNGKVYYSFVDRATNKVVKLDQGLTRTVKSMKRFRFENLSFLFLGMQIGRLFGGWVRQVADVIGITDIWSAILETILIPVLIDLLPLLLGVLDFFNKHPIIAKVVGYFFLFAAVFGTLWYWWKQIQFAKWSKKILNLGTSASTAADDVGLLSGSIKALKKSISKAVTKADLLLAKINKLPKTVSTVINVAIIVAAVWAGIKLADLIWDSLGLEDLALKVSNFFEGRPLLKRLFSAVAASILISPAAGGTALGRGTEAVWGKESQYMKALEKIFNLFGSSLEGAPLGRSISKTGLYYLHAGETVTSPTGRNAGITNNATFSINVYGNADPRRTAEEVLRVIKPEFERLSGSRRI